MSRTAAPLLRTCGQRLLAALLALLALQTLLFASAPAHAQSNNATFVSQNVPSTMVAGQTYDVWIVMKNTGETTWSAASNYKLGSQKPDNNNTWGKSSVALKASVAPGEDAYFEFKVTAPYTPGKYNFQWSMGQYDYWFDAPTDNVVVNVTAPTGNNAAFVTQSVPATMNAGQTYSVSLTLQNTGTSTWSAANNYKLGSQNPADNTTWGTGRATLAANVAPGAQYTFTYNITAPATPGTYNFQWKMLREGVEWFGAATTNLTVKVTAAQGDSAAFVTQSVPSTMTSGQTYSVSVTMKNTGTTTWSAANNYKLGSQNPADNTTWGPSRATLAANVAPGAQYTFTYNVTAPTTLGTQNFQWGMIREGTGWFGANTPNTAVNITASANQPTLSVQRTPTPLVAGQNHTLSWSSTKATSVTYNCTASGTGYTGSATLAANGSATNATSAAWIGYPSTCTWKATGAGGSTTVTETMTTVAAPAVDSVTYFHNDIAGTAQLATNASGALVWKENYLPYGQRQAQAPASAGNRLWYTGKPHEEDTGLTYMGARYYMPLVGRFTGMDPKEFEPGQPHSLNRYAYGNNNPYKYVDPDGRFPALLIPLIWSVGGAVVNGAVNATAQQMATGHVQWGGVGGVLDAAGDGMLLGPVFGAAAARGSGAGVAANAAKGALARGREAEARVLNELGLSKNTQKVTTAEGNAIPDALTSTRSIEIKDTLCVSCTRQIRIQTDAARASGRESILITGEKTHVTPQARETFDTIIRRSDLGPQ